MIAGFLPSPNLALHASRDQQFRCTSVQYARFEAEVYVLGKEEGGRHTPFVNGYTPQFFFRTTDVTGEVALLEGAEMAMPGDGRKLGVQLPKPIALDAGARFAIREGNRTVGSGVVTSVLG